MAREKQIRRTIVTVKWQRTFYDEIERQLVRDELVLPEGQKPSKIPCPNNYRLIDAYEIAREEHVYTMNQDLFMQLAKCDGEDPKYDVDIYPVSENDAAEEGNPNE